MTEAKSFRGDFISPPPVFEVEGVVCEKDVLVSMRDGVQLACDVYRPAQSGEYPVLFATSRYIKDMVHLDALACRRWRETGDIVGWVRRGYVYVLGDSRGSGKSGGQYGFLDETEQSDLYDMIEWAAVQAWSSGKVGMIGESYFGIVQWAAALQNPPHLACIAPYDACSDLYRELVYKGGIYYNAFHEYWDDDTRARTLLHYPQRGARDDYFRLDVLRQLLLHPWYDEFWAVRSFDLSKVTVPAFSIGNWGALNAHLRSNLLAFEKVRGPKKLLVNSGDAQHLFHSPLVEEALARWYEYWLKGVDNGIMDEAPVKIAVRDADGFQYRTEKSWPLARANMRPLFLSPASAGAADSVNDGSLSWSPPHGGAPETSYSYPHPKWSVPPLGGAMVSGKYQLPHSTRTRLTFSTAPLESDLEVCGPIVLKLWASSSANDTQFVVQIVDQPPVSAEMAKAIALLDVAAPAQRVTSGWLKASHRAVDEQKSTEMRPFHPHDAPEPLEPGKVYEFSIEIWPTSWIFRAGHRIRLDVAAADGLYFLGHMEATDTIHHDATHQSRLLLPVIEESNSK
jgi:putative CocE/NonD family hydrolase